MVVSKNELTKDKSKKKLILFLLVGFFCCCGGPAFGLTGLSGTFGEMGSMVRQDFGMQCDIALGPASGSSTPPPTTTAAPRTTAPASLSPTPTENPYASLTFAADDPNATPRDRACASAMRVAPRQGVALEKSSSGPATVCAADLALRYPEAGGAALPADYLRDVIYSASVAGSSGRCVPGRAPHTLATANCGADHGAVVLPETIREQAFCGHIVDPAAISAGDLVFWDYRDNAATRAGIALGGGELVTVDDGKFVRSALPGAGHVQIKRVLREVS